MELWKTAFFWCIGLYFMCGLIVCMVALIEWFEEPYDPDSKWWHVPRAFAFFFFCAPGYAVWLIGKEIIEKMKRKRHVRFK